MKERSKITDKGKIILFLSVCLTVLITVIIISSFALVSEIQKYRVSEPKQIKTDALRSACLKLCASGSDEIYEDYDVDGDKSVDVAELTTFKLSLVENMNNCPTVELTSKGYSIVEIDGVTYIDGILVVNKTYGVPKDYGTGLLPECEEAFKRLVAAAKKDGVDIWISSGFRSYEKQRQFYVGYCNKDGKEKADTYSARPGYSEHQTGLGIDINSASTVKYQGIYKTVGEWIAENCYDYGFIVRYPKGKEAITGYQYEPWHIRYMGEELALDIKESGLCLEEYLGITSQYQK
ncbi:MAG: M15 family metallopeptidase [Acutalibacteraceae bacterium]|nr:M15 family metallopeptidase [Acutalibacteraceae bacterium]